MNELRSAAPTGAASPTGFLDGRGEIAALLLARDWSGHPLGPPAQWPEALKAIVSMVLGTAQPMFVIWGEQRSLIYNAAYREILGRRHPAALGEDLLEVWSDQRAKLTGLVAQARRGEALDQPSFTMFRRDGDGGEEVSYAFTYAPVCDGEGTLGGFTCFLTEITAQLSAQTDLAEVEERLRAEVARVDLAHRSGAIIGAWTWDIQNDRVTADERFASSFGLDPDECASGIPIERVTETVHPDDRAALEQAIGATLAEGDSFGHRYRVRRADGDYYWVQATGRVERDADGRPLFFPGVLLDLEERMRQQRALRESEARFQAVANSIDQMIWLTRPDGYHDYYNDRWYEFTGVAHGTTDGEEWSGMFHPEDQDRAWSVWRQCLATGEPYEIEYRLRHRSGEYRWVLGRAQCERDEQGQILRWYGTCTDIHDRKMAEEELLRTSSLLKLIGESTPDLIYAKDVEGRLIYANPAVGQVLGRDNVIGLSPYDYAIDPVEAEAIMANERQVMAGGQTIERDEPLTGPNGEVRYFRTTKTPLRNAEGTVFGIAAVTEDVTVRRRTEERERLLAREVDHRAKNLLGVVQSVVQLTRAETVEGFKQSLAGRLQSLSRAHSLLAAERWEGVDLRSLVNEELAGFDRSNGRVEIAGPSLRLRPAASQALAMCVHELATNAVKYGALSSAEGRLRVTWAIEGADRELTLEWVEEGGPAVLPPSRSGFGSTVIRSSIERQLSGRIDLDWRPGGLVCKFAIPAGQVADPAPSARHRRPPSPEGESGAARGAGQRILIVEDEALISLQVEEMVERLGFKAVGPAATIAEALSLIAGRAVDAAVLDVSLGRERSDAVAAELVRRRIPYILCTGYAEPAGNAVDGAVATLGKPIDAAALKQALRRAVAPKD